MTPLRGPLPVLAFLEIDSALSRATKAEFGRASDLFAAFEGENIAPILCTGGTACEFEYFAKRLHLWHPLVAEDGSAVVIPRGYFGSPVPAARVGAEWDVLEFTPTHDRVIQTIAATAARLGIAVDMLSQVDARRACPLFGIESSAGRRVTKRRYGEVVQVRGATDFTFRRLVRELRAEQLRCIERGRHVHVVDDQGGTDAVVALRTLYERHCAGVITMTMIDPLGAAITVPASDIVAAIKPDSLPAIARLTFQIATSARERFISDRVRLDSGRLDSVSPVTSATPPGPF